jgi:hypothetical protein
LASTEKAKFLNASSPMCQENVESRGFNLGDWPYLGTYKSGGFGGDWSKMKKPGLLRKEHPSLDFGLYRKG